MNTLNWTYSNIQCAALNFKCCQGQKVIELTQTLKVQGKTDCIDDKIDALNFMNYQIGVLERYAPEGDEIVAEVRAVFVFKIALGIGAAGNSLSVVINGVIVATATVQIGDTATDFAVAVAALIPSQWSATVTAEDGSGYASISLYAPVGTGALYNGTPVTFTYNPIRIIIRTAFTNFDVFRGGISQVIADKPCITDLQAKKIYERLDDICGGGCGCGDDKIFQDSTI